MLRLRVIQLAYRVRQLMWRLLRVRTRGVKVMLFNQAGEVALIRNSYGRSDLFVLPGGGIRPFEDPTAAVKREVREELGVEIATLKLRSVHFSSGEGKRDCIYLFEAVSEAVPTANSLEVREVRFADPDRLPGKSSPATRRRIEEYLGRREPNGDW